MSQPRHDPPKPIDDPAALRDRLRQVWNVTASEVIAAAVSYRPLKRVDGHIRPGEKPARIRPRKLYGEVAQ